MLSFYYEHEDEIQVGVDEAGKGCMIGPVFAAAVIWNNRDLDVSEIKDSKKISRKKRSIIRDYIEKNATAYGVGYATQEEIDDMNISNATYLAMHRALDKIHNIPFDRILVDGNLFKPYKCNLHTCVVGGDNKYVSIAAASILAKEYHDDWITEHFSDDTKYDLMNNKGYGTAKHMKGLESYGLCKEHRRSYCKRFL